MQFSAFRVIYHKFFCLETLSPNSHPLLKVYYSHQFSFSASVYQEVEQHTVSRSRRCTRLRAIYAVGLRLLSHLQRVGDTHSHELSVELLLCLASYTNIEDPWTTQTSYLEASTYLEHCLVRIEDRPTRIQALLTKLLHENVKPAFAKSKNSAVTPAGRKAISALAPKLEASIDEIKLKPWKYSQVYIVTVFEWILRQLDVRLPLPCPDTQKHC